MSTQNQQTANGVNLEQMVKTVEALKNQPSLARFQFRASNRWINGGENRSRIQGFYGAGVEDETRNEPFEFTNGEPPVLLGNNEGANPVEYLLHALAGCITTTTVLHATARGIHIHNISTELSGDIDLQGFLALDDQIAVGYESIRIDMHIEADCSDEELDKLISFAKDHSPVCATVCRPVPVTLKRVKKMRAVA
ncbi:MAG: OsmC family protein [Gammaproteobacteria bacterium]|nr:OsmC family protein [Gammaproteobacteria bacterium]